MRDHALGHRRVGDADGLAVDAGRVGERAEEVERGGRAELAAHRRGEAHRRVEARREAEPDARPRGCSARHAFGTEVDHHTERLEHVGRTALRRRGASAVLRDLRTRGRGDERGHRRHVDRAGAVAAGAAGVDERSVDVAEVDAVGELEHRAHERGELAGGLALRAQRDREPGDLRVGRVTGRGSTAIACSTRSSGRSSRRSRRPMTSGHSAAIIRRRRLPVSDA